MGVFAGLAGAVAGADEEAARRQRQADADAEAQRQRSIDDEQRAIARASTLAALREHGIVQAGEREMINQPTMPGVHVAASGKSREMQGTPIAAPPSNIVDEKRYDALGNTGYVQDRTKTPSAVAERSAQRKEQELRNRIAAVRARNADYKDASDDALRAIAEDDGSYREALKGPKAPGLKDTNVLNPGTGMIEDVYDNGSRKIVRRATKEELDRAKRVPPTPRDPNAPPPRAAEDQVADREKVADALAYSAVEAANGDVAAALASLNRPGEYERAQKAGVTFRHLKSAAQRYKDRLTSKSKEADAPVDIRAKYGMAPAAGGGRGAAPAAAAPPAKPPAAAAPDPAEGRGAVVSADPIVQEAFGIIVQGGGTLDQAKAVLSPRRYAELEKIVSARRPKTP